MEECFVRVETIQLSDMQSVGGYMCAVNSLLALFLGIKPTDDAEELVQLVDESDKPEVQFLMAAFYELGDIPHPEIYVNDKANHICLYQGEEFEEIRDYLQDISDLLTDYTKDLVLAYKEFYLDDEEILYSDPYQIVISKETYEKHKEEAIYEIMF